MLLFVPAVATLLRAEDVVGVVCGLPGRHRASLLLLQASLLRAVHEDARCPAVTLGDAAPVTLTEPAGGTAGVLVASASPCPELRTRGDVVCADGARRRLDFGGRRFRVLTLDFPPYVTTVPVDASTAVATGVALNAGVEVQLVALLASRANLTLEVRDGGADSWLPNLDALRTGAVDACVGGYWGAAERLPLFHVTPPYVWERLRLFVPPPTPRPGWQSVFLVFDAAVWALLLLSFGAATLLAARVSDARDWGGAHRLAGAAMATLSALLYTAPARAPRRPRLRALFLLWAAFCLQVDVAFQSALVGHLVNPGTEAGVSSVSQLLGAAPPLRPAMMERGIEIMNASDDARYVALAARATPCRDILRCLRRVQRRRRLAVLSCEEFVRFSVGDGVRTLPETFISYGVVTYLRRDAPWTRRLSDLVTGAVEAGLVVKWAADLRRGRPAPWDDEEDAPPDDLGVGNLQASFWLLGAGLGVAGVVFAGEVAVSESESD